MYVVRNIRPHVVSSRGLRAARNKPTATHWTSLVTNIVVSTMASRSLAPILRRSVAKARTSSKALRGGTPPMPAFARIPAPSEPLVENHDCLFDDACAPELALDFDCQNISTKEGITSWFIGMGLFASLFYTIKYVEDPPACNPAITRAESDDIVIPLKHHE